MKIVLLYTRRCGTPVFRAARHTTICFDVLGAVQCTIHTLYTSLYILKVSYYFFVITYHSMSYVYVLLDAYVADVFTELASDQWTWLLSPR